MDERDIYTFSDFCVDQDMLSLQEVDDLRHLKAMWSIYEKDYLDYCEIYEYEHELL